MTSHKINFGTIFMICPIAGMVQTAYALGDDMVDLDKHVSSFDDPRVIVQDPAFIPAAHSHDATPKTGYGELKPNGAELEFGHIGERSGLCDIISALTALDDICSREIK